VFQNNQVCVVWNIYIPTAFKASRFIDAFNSLIDVGLVHHSIRIRGEFGNFIKENLSRAAIDKSYEIRWFHKELSRDWQLNTLEQVLQSQTNLVLLMQEDHICLGERQNVSNFIKYFLELDCESSPLSFYYTYKEQREILSSAENISANKYGVFTILEKNWQRDIPTPRFPVSLVGLFKKSSLITMLLNTKPFIKKYPPLTPFNFEQAPNQEWFLPLKFALPKFEFLACIDDDAKIPNTSLQNKAIYYLDNERTDKHNQLSTVPDVQQFLKKVNKFLKVNGSRLPFKFLISLNWIQYLLNTLYWVRYRFSLKYRKHLNILKKIQRLIQ
jgi:hypothetical protein